jgi:hypothetical protein
MITNRQRYEARHAQICQRAERESAAGTTVETLVAAVHRAIEKRDSIAAAYAVAAAHIALKCRACKGESISQRSKASASNTKDHPRASAVARRLSGGACRAAKGASYAPTMRC